MKSGSGNYLLRIIWYNSPTEFFKAKTHITEITTQVTEMMHKNIKLLYQELDTSKVAGGISDCNRQIRLFW